jgi:hypothetical protein
MTVARAVGSTGSAEPHYHVNIRVGAHRLVADEPAGQGAISRTITVPADLPSDRVDALGRIAERTPVSLALQAGTPITTTFRFGAPIRPGGPRQPPSAA